MVCAIDQVDQKSLSLNNPHGMAEEELADAEMLAQDEAAQGVCYTTQCNERCSPGDYEAAQMNGQPGLDLILLGDRHPVVLQHETSPSHELSTSAS